MPLAFVIALFTQLFAPGAWGVACSAVFTNGVQSHSSSGSVYAGYNAAITGGTRTLDTPAYSTASPPGQGSCAGSSCVASGSPAAASTVVVLTGTASDGNISLGYRGTATRPAGDYGSVTLDNESTLTLNSVNGTYRMRALRAQFQSRLVWASGSYWINGNVSLENNVTMQKGSGSGPVRIFVNGNVTLGFNSSFSGFGPQDLLIYASGSITVNTRNTVPGFLYAAGTLQADYQSRFSGALAARRVELGQETRVSFAASVVPDLEFAPFCDGGTVAANLVAHWRMNESAWVSAASEVWDSSGNGNHGTARGGANTARSAPARPGDPGTCAYGTFDGQDDTVSVVGLSSTLNGSASLAFWIKTTQVGNDLAWQAPGITGVEQSGGTNDIFWGWIDSGGRIGLSVGDDFTTKSTTRINTGSWRHVVLTRDLDRGAYKIYIDGTLHRTGSISRAMVTTPYSSIGRIEDTASSPEYFNGQLDEVRVYSGVLSDTEVTNIFNEVYPCGSTICPSGAAKPGLKGHYYNNMNFESPVTATRIDGPVDFFWDLASPGVSGVAEDLFSVRWTGRLYITQTGNYRFQLRSDDGVRLWVNNQLVIENWAPHSVTEDTSANIPLVAGQAYDIRLDYYEEYVNSEIRLRWSTPGSSGSFLPIPPGNVAGSAAGLYHCEDNRVAYYSLAHPGTAVTCDTLPVTVRAHDVNGDIITPPAGTGIVLSASGATSGTSWVDTPAHTYSGEEDIVIRRLRQVTPANIDLGVTDGDASGASGPVVFSDKALVFYQSDATEYPIADRYSGEVDNAPVVRAVETAQETGECRAMIAGESHTVDMAFRCENPTQCANPEALQLGEYTLRGVGVNDEPSFTPVLLDFNEQGVASIPLSYSDVGRLQLLARMEVEVPADTAPSPDLDTTATLTGASNPFVVRPWTLVVNEVTSDTGEANPATQGDGAGFAAAGQRFSVSVQSLNKLGEVTPNFGNETEPSSVQLSLSDLVFPVGGELGLLTSGSFERDAPGTVTDHQVAWDNVGAIRLTPRLLNNHYLNAGDMAETTESDVIGRFYPHDYELPEGNVEDACNTFSYLGQPGIDVNYSLSARSVGGAIVTNYDHVLYGESALATPGMVAESENAGNGWLLSPRVNVAEAQWRNGVYSVNDPSASLARADSTEPDGPWYEVRWGVALSDVLDGRALVNPNMQADSTEDCVVQGSCTAVRLDGALNLRFGRLRMDSAFGPEVLDLPVPFLTEYWNGSEFVRSVEDSCTQIPRSAITYEPTGSLTNDSHRTVPIGGGSTQGLYTSLDTEGVQFFASSASQRFTAPGAGNTGEFDILVDLTDIPWLRFDWNQDGDHQNDIALPPANVGFGSYRGHDRIIYWREILE